MTLLANHPELAEIRERLRQNIVLRRLPRAANDELEALLSIVDYRKANGAFRSPEQLASVKGIGLSTIERNRDRIVVGGGAAAPAKGAPAKAAVTPRPTGAKR